MIEFCTICNSLLVDGSCSNKHCKNRAAPKKKSSSTSKRKVQA